MATQSDLGTGKATWVVAVEAGPEYHRLEEEEEEEGCWGRAGRSCGQGPRGSLPSPPRSKVPFFREASGLPSATRPGTPGPRLLSLSLQPSGSAGFSPPGCTVLTRSLPWGRQPAMFPDVFCRCTVGAGKAFAVCVGEGGCF